MKSARSAGSSATLVLHRGAIAALLAFALGPASAQAYSVTELRDDGGYKCCTGVGAYALNIRGEAVGATARKARIGNSSYWDTRRFGARWTADGARSDLVTDPAQHGWRVVPYDVNDDGLAAGYVDGGPPHAVVVGRDGVAVPIVPDAAVRSVATSINQAGEVVGWAGNDGFLWSPSKGLRIFSGDDPRRVITPYGINNLGVVVGQSVLDRGRTHSTVHAFYRGVDQLMRIVPEMYRFYAVNDAGTAIGEFADPGEFITARVYDPMRGARKLPELPQVKGECTASSINNRGEIVGYCYGNNAACLNAGEPDQPGFSPALWTPTTDGGYAVRDVNELVASAELPNGEPMCYAIDINDAGMILARGENTASGKTYAVVLKP